MTSLPDLTRASGAFALVLALASCSQLRFEGAVGASEFVSAEVVDVFGPERVAAIVGGAFEEPASALDQHGRTDPVVVLVAGDEARAYPLRVLVWHEIVNDVVGGVPVAVTYSPLSDTTVAFDSRVDGRRLIFGTSGKLYRAALVLYDRQTVTLWPQPSGRAEAGPLAGRTLRRVPAIVTTLGAFADGYPQGRVLADPELLPGYRLSPYQGYERRPEPSESFLLREPDPRLEPMRRVVGVAGAGRTVAYPLDTVAEAGALNDEDVVILWQPGVRSVLDRVEIASAATPGSAAVFSRIINGRTLTLRQAAEGGFVDGETGSRWNSLGRATGGPLAGRSLEPVVATPGLWFAWAAFNPSTLIYGVG